MVVTDFVLDEAITILGRRRGVGPKVATQFAEAILDSPRVRFTFVDSVLFREALAVYAKFGAGLSFTDATTVAVMRRLGCETLFSHDAGFDRVPGITRRIRAD